MFFHTSKVPLSALASNVAENNFVGGCFNATTRLKMVPLPAQYLSQITSNKGKRSVRLHSQRYNPTHDSCDERTAIRYSDSLVNVQKKRERQELHYALGIDQVEQAKQRKALNRIIPHRADCMFYMNGHSANINRRSMFSSNELSKLPPDSLSENRQLYYGRGIQISQTRPSSKAIAKLQEQLINQQAETNSSEFKLEKIRQDSSYRQSPTVSFSIPPPSPTASGRDSLMSAVYGKKAIFITEESRSNN